MIKVIFKNNNEVVREKMLSIEFITELMKNALTLREKNISLTGSDEEGQFEYTSIELIF